LFEDGFEAVGRCQIGIAPIVELPDKQIGLSDHPMTCLYAFTRVTVISTAWIIPSEFLIGV
jgi:hypothetical protein